MEYSRQGYSIFTPQTHNSFTHMLHAYCMVVYMTTHCTLVHMVHSQMAQVHLGRRDLRAQGLSQSLPLPHVLVFYPWVTDNPKHHYLSLGHDMLIRLMSSLMISQMVTVRWQLRLWQSEHSLTWAVYPKYMCLKQTAVRANITNPLHFALSLSNVLQGRTHQLLTQITFRGWIVTRLASPYRCTEHP